MFILSRRRNVRVRDALRLNCAGPVMEFRPAFPQLPAVGATNAAGLRNLPPLSRYKGAPVTLGRKVPVNPVPRTGARITGVRGVPLPAVSCVVRVHSRKALPRQPSKNPPTRENDPVVYWLCTVT